MNKPNNLYLICGDEEYLKEQKKNELLKALKCEDSINFNAFSDESIDIDEIASLINTLPFMSEYRTVVISDSGWFAGSVSEDITEVFEAVPETSIVIFCEKKADKTNALYKTVKVKGEILCFEMAESKAGKAKTAGKGEVRDWAKQELKKAGRRIDSRTLNDLTELTGYDMQNLSTELEKLICYTMDKPANYVISMNDVNAICSRTIQDRVFDMIGYKLKGDVTHALSILEELFAIKTAAMLILHVTVKQYERALSYRECVMQGLGEAETMAKLSIRDWQLKRIREQTGNTSAKELIVRLEACAETEYRIKTGDLSDRLGLELLMIR